MNRNYIFVFLFLFGCNYKKDSELCIFTSEDLWQKDSIKVFGTNTANGRITEYRDKGIDSIEAGYYTFFDNGNIESYNFFTDMTSYIYSEKYDSSGTLIKVEGEPLVRKLADRVSLDSLLIKLYFFSLNKKYDSIKVHAMGDQFFKVGLNDDTTFSNMKVGAFGINFHGKPEINLSFSVKYADVCAKRTKELQDSIVLYYNKK